MLTIIDWLYFVVNSLYIKKPLTIIRQRLFQRCLAESNRCSRFCRPVPNRSAKAPLIGNAKITLFLLSANISALKRLEKLWNMMTGWLNIPYN